MEVRQLRYFVAVAEERSFTRAAERLHLSQQALSAAVTRFERQLGCALLERTTQRVDVTTAGAALLTRAPAVFEAVDAAHQAVQAALGRVEGTLRLRYGLDSEALVEPLLRGFGDRHPGVSVRAWTGMDVDNLAALRAGEVEAVFAWTTAPADARSAPVAREEAYLALPDRHPLAHLDAVPPGRLVDETLVMFPREGAPAVWDALVAGLRPEPAAAPIVELPVSAQEAMVEAVLRGEGVAPVSSVLADRLARPGIVLRPLEPALVVDLLLVWRGTPGEVLQALVDDLTVSRGVPR